jgi:hypothetical protein
MDNAQKRLPRAAKPGYGSPMGLKRRIVILIISAFFGCAVLGAAFWRFRAPLLLVLDDEFAFLYGIRRGAVKRAELSLRLFRRVEVARIAEGASPDVVAFAAAAAAPSGPYAALFPARYRQGARRYAEQAPEVPVGVFGGGVLFRPEENDGFRFIETDKKTDLYRAGRCAALFAFQGEGGVLFFAGDLIDRDDRAAFEKGLLDQGFTDTPLFVDRGMEYALPEGLACVVMGSPAENSLENSALPVILFSWIDPGFTNRGVKIIFDDSPWALAFESARALQGQGELPPAASEALVLRDRIGDGKLRRGLKKALRSGFPP